MARLDELPEYCPANISEWRDWLRLNHGCSPGVWLVYFKANSGKQRLSYSDAVDEALCWGWIDSKVQSLDPERYRQVFTPRKPRSVWSAVNKRKLARLESAGRLQPAGVAAITLAKQNGAWESLDAIESLHVPSELAALFARRPDLEKLFAALAPSKRKALLSWLAAAKRPVTRESRLIELEAVLPAGRLPAAFSTIPVNRKPTQKP